MHWILGWGVTAATVEAVLPKINPYANDAGSCQRGVEIQSCSIAADPGEVYVVRTTTT